MKHVLRLLEIKEQHQQHPAHYDRQPCIDVAQPFREEVGIFQFLFDFWAKLYFEHGVNVLEFKRRFAR